VARKGNFNFDTCDIVMKYLQKAERKVDEFMQMRRLVEQAKGPQNGNSACEEHIVTSVCSKYFIYFKRMLQVFYLDVAYVSYTCYVESECFKYLRRMLQQMFLGCKYFHGESRAAHIHTRGCERDTERQANSDGSCLHAGCRVKAGRPCVGEVSGQRGREKRRRHRK
jgi:hypothetical protein